MKIKKALKFFNIKSKDNRKATYLTTDSRLVKKNTIFLAIDKSINYLNTWNIEPLLILSNIEMEGVISVPSLKEKLKEFAFYFYHLKRKSPKLIGIVGTNGKTSVATILHHLLKKSYILTTIEGIDQSFCYSNTTPTLIEIINAINETKKIKGKYLILEVSSIGIKEKRVEGLAFSYIIFTNLKEDHLDYHATLKDYQNTKIDFLVNSKATLLVNTNDEFANKLFLRKGKTYGYSFSQDIIIKKTLTYSVFRFQNYLIHTNLISSFNIENLVAVLSLLSVMHKHIDFSKIEQLKRIKGRMDTISLNPNVIIDYAHTASAMESALKETKELCHGRLIVVFGAGGNRDITKRPVYGELVLKYSDIAIVTNDNPRDEDEKQIVKDIVNGHEKDFKVIYDRSKAIHYALKIIKSQDILLILGKGHEEYQLINKEKIAYSDYTEVKKWLLNLK